MRRSSPFLAITRLVRGLPAIALSAFVAAGATPGPTLAATLEAPGDDVAPGGGTVPAMPPNAPSNVPRLTIQAPAALKALLDSYLDLARAIRLPDAAQISDAEWSRLIAAMPAQAAELAQTEGYFAAQAQVEARNDTADGAPAERPDIVLTLDPGPPARVGKLTLEIQGALADAAQAAEAGTSPPGSPALPTAEPDSPQAAQALIATLRTQWQLPTGAAFSISAWDNAKNGTLAQLRAAGYAAAAWSGTGAEVDPDTQRVRIFVVVDSGPLFRAGEIEVSGLVHHDAERVRNMAGFGTGAALTEVRLQDFQERLGKAGLFDQVSVSINPDPEQAAHCQVRVQVRETPLNSATTSLGISATAGPRVGLEHSHRQVFGLPLTSRIKLEWGRNRQAADLELASHPDAALRRYIEGYSVERLLTDTDMVLSQTVRVGRSQDKPSVERNNFVEVTHTDECARDGDKFIDCVALGAVSANTYSTWRRVDNVLLPTEGVTLSTQLGAGMADGTASLRGGFGRVYGRLTGYQPLGGWYGQARLELGRVLTPAGVQVPDSLRFRAGGDNSVRGYAWRTLAPTKADGSVTGGRMLFTSSLELAHPLADSQPDLWGAVFVDAGRAADQLTELHPALGYGLGLRWRSPVGPLNIDWAWGKEVHRGRLHLNVGVAF